MKDCFVQQGGNSITVRFYNAAGKIVDAPAQDMDYCCVSK